MDVVRAVCGPADVSEAKLDHARREATKEALDMVEEGGEEEEVWEGVWHTEWWCPAIIAQKCMRCLTEHTSDAKQCKPRCRESG